MPETVSARPLWVQIATAGGLAVVLAVLFAVLPFFIQPPPRSALEWAGPEGVALILGVLGIVGLVVGLRLRRGVNLGSFVRAFAENFPYSRRAQIEMKRARDQGPAPPRAKTR